MTGVPAGPSRDGAAPGTGTAAGSAATAARLGDFARMAKPRLNALTVFAVAAGWCAAGGALLDVRLAVVTAGAALLAAGSAVLNQWIERGLDARMRRTMDRPLPAGRVGPRDAAALGLLLSGAGLFVLHRAGNPLTAALGAACLLSYVLVYTPLKTRTTLNTLAGTLPGALPPVMGVAAAAGALPPVAWFLFALLTAWQLPHFLSIAWLYRDDYRRAGFLMLPVVAGGEESTARQAVVHSVLVLLVSLTAAPLGLAGRVYFGVALVAGVLFVAAAARFSRRRDDGSARLLLRASLVHLPLVLVAFAWDRR